MARSQRLTCLAALACATLLALAGCSLEPVRLGAVLPTSGAYSTYGVSLERGASVAAEVVNREGGVQGRRLEILLRDSRSDPQRAAEEFGDLVKKEKVAAVVGGGTSAEALAMVPVAQKEGRVLLSPSASSPDLTPAGEWVFRNWPSDEIEARTMADFSAFTLHVTEIAIVEEKSAYARGIVDAFVSQFRKDGRSVDRVVLPPGDVDYRAAAQTVRALQPRAQALYLVGFGERLVLLHHAIASSGLALPVLSVSALSDSDILKRNASDLEGAVFARPSYDPDSDAPAFQEFLAEYTSRYRQEPDLYAAHAYDSVRLLAEAMAMEGIAPDEIRRGLLKIKNFAGAAGSVTFDANGDIAQSFELCVIQGGKAVPLSRADDSVLAAIQKRVDRLRFGS